MSEREIYLRTAEAAADRYQRDSRFRAMAMSIAHEVMREHVERNPDQEYREVANTVDRAVTVTMERIFHEDAELRAQREMADRYRKIAEDALATSMPTLFIPKAPG